jgi:hypothetical protein
MIIWLLFTSQLDICSRFIVIKTARCDSWWFNCGSISGESSVADRPHQGLSSPCTCRHSRAPGRVPQGHVQRLEMSWCVEKEITHTRKRSTILWIIYCTWVKWSNFYAHPSNKTNSVSLSGAVDGPAQVATHFQPSRAERSARIKP